VVEILSTSTASRDRGEKKAVYEKNGVKEYWIVDHRAREVVVFVLESEGGRYAQERVVVESERLLSLVLSRLEVELREVFP
jgi:Uma2 family endonuclease